MSGNPVDGEVPGYPLLHMCLMTCASDMTLLDSAPLRHGLSWVDGCTRGVSLDQKIICRSSQTRMIKRFPDFSTAIPADHKVCLQYPAELEYLGRPGSPL